MAILARNPIAWQELNHQQRSAPRVLRRWRFVGPMFVLLLFTGVVLTLRSVYAPTRELALYLIYLIHALVVVRAIVAGANAVSREHVGQTWDALILTGVSTRSILLGKWYAAMTRTAPWMIGLGVLRLAMLPVFMYSLVNRYAWRVSYYNSNYNNGFDDPRFFVEWLPWAVMLAVVATVVLTFLEVAAATILGIAASAAARRGVTALVIALAVRFTPVALFAGLTRYNVNNGPSYRALRFTPFAIADSGTAPLYQLMLPVTSWTRISHTAAIPGLLLAAGVLMIILVGSFIVAWWALRITGSLPHPKEEMVGMAFRRAETA